MRRKFLFALTVVVFGAALPAFAQQKPPVESKPATAPVPVAPTTVNSPIPTIDQSLEWKSAFNPKISPDGMRVVYEVQKTNWEDNAFERNLWIADIASGEA